MDFRILRYFLNVAKEQSFTKAAQQLHITQPTLSRQLAALEEELGVTLFARSGRNITLTEEGILFKRRALEILDLEERTLDELENLRWWRLWRRYAEIISRSILVSRSHFIQPQRIPSRK